MEIHNSLSYELQGNFFFLKSIPKPVHDWSTRKKDFFAMLRQLGEPIFFLTMSVDELGRPHSLNRLNKLREGITRDENERLSAFPPARKALQSPAAIISARRSVRFLESSTRLPSVLLVSIMSSIIFCAQRFRLEVHLTPMCCYG